MLRASWNKQLNPYIRLSAIADRGILGIREDITIDRPANPPSPSAFQAGNNNHSHPPVRARLYFSGTRKALLGADSLILMFPGGGFTAMPPLAHEDYTSIWARRTGVPIVSVDYDKCPEKPYPWALEQCFDVYRAIVESNGECVGMGGWWNSVEKADGTSEKIKRKPIKIVMTGDSAGGNFVAAVVLKVLDGSTGIDLRSPNGLVITYPAFTFDPSCWLPNQHRQLFRSASSVSAPMSSFVHTRGTIRPENPFALPPAPHAINVLKDEVGDRRDTWYRRMWELLWGRMSTSPRIPSALTMSSHFSYFTDLIMPPEILRAISMLLLGTSPVRIRFDEDYLLSPIVAPEELLARFPKVHFLCGEKDPFVDDVVILGERIRQAKTKAHKQWLKMKEVREHYPPNNVSSPRRRFSSSNNNHDEDVLSMKGKNNRGAGSSSTAATSIAYDGVRASATTANLVFPSNDINKSNLTDYEFNNHIFRHDPNAMVHTKILEGISHGFLLMLAILPEARPAVHLCSDWMSEMLEDDQEMVDVKVDEISSVPVTAIVQSPPTLTAKLESVLKDGESFAAAAASFGLVSGGRWKANSSSKPSEERLRHGSVHADSVLERRRNRFAENHEIGRDLA
ncbi:hypothetical protein HDU82_008557 [Entophlyctis luteolus]|nr:hypothetical protein HDU82_008557 [Entophlyctis luteolus]KAJ3394847.1 hypothetical protein HDU84_005782 [Entophlyctis sp. JEL0112]